MTTPEAKALTNWCAATAKREILAAVVERKPFYPGGKVPQRNIKHFGLLHDYCDANCLGGMCDDEVAGLGDRLFPNWIEQCGRIQNDLNEWIAKGRMRDVAAWISDMLVPEQRECLLDPERNDEAHDMLDDLEHRVGTEQGFRPYVMEQLRSVLVSMEENALVRAALSGNVLVRGTLESDKPVSDDERETAIELRKAAARMHDAAASLRNALNGASELEAFVIVPLIGQATALATNLTNLSESIKE